MTKESPKLFRFCVVFVLILLVSFCISAQDKAPKKISDFTEKMQKIDGYMPLYWSAADGKMYLEISRFNQEFLHQVSLPTGVGSNPIGLDRGQPGPTKVVFFQQVGNKILLVQPNYEFRALSNNPA